MYRGTEKLELPVAIPRRASQLAYGLRMRLSFGFAPIFLTGTRRIQVGMYDAAMCLILSRNGLSKKIMT